MAIIKFAMAIIKFAIAINRLSNKRKKNQRKPKTREFANNSKIYTAKQFSYIRENLNI